MELSGALREQGLGSKVIADMFGMALRSYQAKVQRLFESQTERGRSPWEAPFDYLERKSRTACARVRKPAPRRAGCGLGLAPAAAQLRLHAFLFTGSTLAARASFPSLGPTRAREALALQFRQQKFDAPLDHGAEVATWQRMAQKVSAELKPLAKLGARRELDSAEFPRNRANSLARRGLREPTGDEFLDFSLAPPRGSFEELAMILFGQVAVQELEGRKVQRTRREELDDHRKTPSEPRGDDAAKGLAFTQAKFLHAEGEQGGKPREQVQAPLLDFAQV